MQLNDEIGIKCFLAIPECTRTNEKENKDTKRQKHKIKILFVRFMTEARQEEGMNIQKTEKKLG